MNFAAELKKNHLDLWTYFPLEKLVGILKKEKSPTTPSLLALSKTLNNLGINFNTLRQDDKKKEQFPYKSIYNPNTPGPKQITL
jgi:hypothetical protein